ncbi:hypothetical protein MRB53_041258 [Persea americana]|nr:hypothetical protein MRB53_041258 [Persea americana]
MSDQGRNDGDVEYHEGRQRHRIVNTLLSFDSAPCRTRNMYLDPHLHGCRGGKSTFSCSTYLLCEALGTWNDSRAQRSFQRRPQSMGQNQHMFRRHIRKESFETDERQVSSETCNLPSIPCACPSRSTHPRRTAEACKRSADGNENSGCRTTGTVLGKSVTVTRPATFHHTQGDQLCERCTLRGIGGVENNHSKSLLEDVSQYRSPSLWDNSVLTALCLTRDGCHRSQGC